MQRRVTVHLSTANLDKFYQLYGASSLSWALDGLLEKFVRTHIQEPQDVMEVAAKLLLSDLNRQ